MLRQDPTECLFSFICTSNNHISRIQGMVERLCQALGAPLCQLDQTAYHNFPSLSVLAGVHFCLFSEVLLNLLLDCTQVLYFFSALTFPEHFIIINHKIKACLFSL